MDRPQKITRGFIVAGSNGAKLLEFGKKVLDEMASLIEMFVIGIRLDPIRFGGNHWVASQGFELLAYPLISIIGFVRQQSLRIYVFK